MSRDLRSIAGLLLYRHLPEEYRYRDNPTASEVGDLEAYLHGFGHLLDRTRATLEQFYADAFAEPVEFPYLKRREGADGPELEVRRRHVQDWLLPYLAELLGAELIAPDPGARRLELANAVLWSQSRGTLQTIDSLSDVVAAAETVTVEGWRRVLTIPNLTLPPFTRELSGAARLPRGTPDFRFRARAVQVDWPEDALARGRFSGRNANGEPETRDVAWRIDSPQGLPCFPGSFEDPALRTPDIRTPTWRVGQANAARVTVHVRPPFGFFEPGLAEFAVQPDDFPDDPTGETAEFGPAEVLGDPETGIDKLVVTGDVAIAPGGPIVLHDLLFRGEVTVKAGAHLRMERCAAARVTIERRGRQPVPAFEAQDSLFDVIHGPKEFALLEYVTVLSETHLRRVWASDCLFLGSFDKITCGLRASCVRFSRLPPDTDISRCKGLFAPPNTTAMPVFMPFYGKSNGDCVLAVPRYGEPGCAVLHSATAAAIAEGAEDEGEMGGHHHRYHMARLRALRRKLEAHIPARIEPVIALDTRLSAPPPLQKQSA